MAKKAVTKKVVAKKPVKKAATQPTATQPTATQPAARVYRMLNKRECQYIAELFNDGAISGLHIHEAAMRVSADKGNFSSPYDQAVRQFLDNPPPHPIRMEVSDTACRRLLKEFHNFGYPELTLEQLRLTATAVRNGTYSDTDVIACILAKQLDDVQELLDQRDELRNQQRPEPKPRELTDAEKKMIQLRDNVIAKLDERCRSASASSDSNYYADSALVLLLIKYRDALPTMDGYFHKCFRQCDVTDNGTIDMVIHKLLDQSVRFWKVLANEQLKLGIKNGDEEE